MSEELLWLAVLAHAHWQRGMAAQASAMGQEGDGEFRGARRVPRDGTGQRRRVPRWAGVLECISRRAAAELGASSSQ